MTPLDLFLVPGVFLTATLSGTLGMGGGMLLMGLYGQLLPPAAALALHGVTQLASNGSRAAAHRQRIERRVLLPYCLGTLGALGVFTLVDFRPSTRGLFFLLGLLPFAAAYLPATVTIDAERPQTAGVCGAAVGTLHLLAGVSGALLDVFFLRSPMDRRGVVATKAATQTLAHGLKLVYFARLSGAADLLTPGRVLAIWAAALAGTMLGKRLLESLDERRFRGAGDLVVKTAGTLYLMRALAG